MRETSVGQRLASRTQGTPTAQEQDGEQPNSNSEQTLHRKDAQMAEKYRERT